MYNVKVVHGLEAHCDPPDRIFHEAICVIRVEFFHDLHHVAAAHVLEEDEVLFIVLEHSVEADDVFAFERLEKAAFVFYQLVLGSPQALPRHFHHELLAAVDAGSIVDALQITDVAVPDFIPLPVESPRIIIVVLNRPEELLNLVVRSELPNLVDILD